MSGRSPGEHRAVVWLHRRRPAVNHRGAGSAQRLLDAMAAQLDAQDWRGDALCAQVDHDVFFPEKGGNTGDAKRICLGCPARQACLDYALDNDERFGIWGGKSERERRAILKQRKQQQTEEVAS